MKKILCILAACLLLPVGLGWAPHAWAEDTADSSVVIGDGAPIPYLDGFESALFSDADDIVGITGALPDIVDTLSTDAGVWTLHLQNIILTDDVIGCFFTQTYSQPISYEGDMPYAYSFASLWPDILVDGSSPQIMSQFSEGHPIDACSQYSLILCSLAEPIQDGQILTLGATWNLHKQVWEGGVRLRVDRSSAKDPTVAYCPMVHVQKPIVLWEGEQAVQYDFTVQRVAYTPFGNRMLLRFAGTNENSQYLDYQLFDQSGKALNLIPPSFRFQSNASVEHPASTANEVWFFGGENSSSLTLVPLGGNASDGQNASRVTSLPLDTLPADVVLENGVTMHVDSCALSNGGFYALYSTDGYAGYVSFDIGDAEGNSLGFIFTSYLMDQHRRGLLGYGGYWSEEYKGKTVPRVLPDQLTQAKTLLITYTVGYPQGLSNEAIDIALTR